MRFALEGGEEGAQEGERRLAHGEAVEAVGGHERQDVDAAHLEVGAVGALEAAEQRGARPAHVADGDRAQALPFARALSQPLEDGRELLIDGGAEQAAPPPVPDERRRGVVGVELLEEGARTCE